MKPTVGFTFNKVIYPSPSSDRPCYNRCAMPALDVILAPALAPDDLLGLELHFLDAIGTRQTPPVLLIYTSPGRAISIGRYHLYCGPPERDGINVFRRLTGGRVVGAGQGWLGLALILPTRTAMLKEDATRLKPDQIMNRYARGILTAMRALGVDCFYPGRDAITFEQREIAMCTFETDAAGAMLFEASVAHNRGMEELVHDLERIDPDGALSCRMYDAASATKMVRELARDISFDELADAIASGYQSSLGETRRRELTAIETAQAQSSRSRSRQLELAGRAGRGAAIDAEESNRIATRRNRGCGRAQRRSRPSRPRA